MKTSQPYNRFTLRQMILPEKQIKWVIKHHPVLKKNTPLRLLFVFLARGGYWRDIESGNILLPYGVLTEFMGKTLGNCNTEELLREFQEKIAPDFLWKDYWHEGQKCRQVLNSGIANLPEELLVPEKGEKLLYVETLKECTEKSLQTTVRAERGIAKTFTYSYADQVKITDYAHALPTRLFSEPLLENFEKAYAIAMGREDRKTLVALLYTIRSMPLPIYWESQRVDSLCPRLFGISTQVLPKVIRRTLYPEWLELDITSCQLAIAGGIFHIEAIQEFLRKGLPIWPELMDHLEIPLEKRKEAKPFIKECLYSIVYGMPGKSVEANITIGLANIGLEKKNRFLEHPLLKELVKAVEQVKETIQKQGGMQSAYGWLEYKKSTDIDSFLSYVIQTYELALITSCFEVAINEKKNCNKTFYITLLQHDGISIQILPGVSKESVLLKLQQAFILNAVSLGIIATITE